MNSTNWPYFYFIRKSMVGLDINKIIDLVISRAIFIREKIVISFFGLFL